MNQLETKSCKKDIFLFTDWWLFMIDLISKILKKVQMFANKAAKWESFLIVYFSAKKWKRWSVGAGKSKWCFCESLWTSGINGFIVIAGLEVETMKSYMLTQLIMSNMNDSFTLHYDNQLIDPVRSSCSQLSLLLPNPDLSFLTSFLRFLLPSFYPYVLPSSRNLYLLLLGLWALPALPPRYVCPSHSMPTASPVPSIIGPLSPP